ncbi:ATP-binding protein [Streptomyces sp. SP18CS02]|uniref:ATP-binding protein n=1 Tax=Streptomyces sp. SP18CS02 TaxID=3002531 RepID=UPI002E78D049|nr:ATP-binding protein [Streptomyces sp. SP18CS02]MEE1756605.1 ATP-binding protein [Streptomyces sp. SP18CS02]
MKNQSLVTVRAFTQRFSSTRLGARLARHLAGHRLDTWGIPYGSDCGEAAALIVAELAANAATHGRVPGRDFELRLVLSGARELRIEVSDARGERRPLLARPEDQGECGRGLLLVATLAEAWGVVERRPVGKTVWAELRTGGHRPFGGACLAPSGPGPWGATAL